MVVGDNRGEEQHPDAALADQIRIEVVLGRRTVHPRRQPRGVERLEEPFVATADQVGKLDIDDIPMDVARFHLGADLRQPAAVVVQRDFDTGIGGKRLEIGLLASLGVRAAPRDNGHGLGRRIGGSDHAEPDEHTGNQPDRGGMRDLPFQIGTAILTGRGGKVCGIGPEPNPDEPTGGLADAEQRGVFRRRPGPICGIARTSQGAGKRDRSRWGSIIGT